MARREVARKLVAWFLTFPLFCFSRPCLSFPVNLILNYLTDVLVLQRDFTTAVPATGQEVACDESNRRHSCGVADRRSKPKPQAHPARAGARRPARASAPHNGPCLTLPYTRQNRSRSASAFRSHAQTWKAASGWERCSDKTSILAHRPRR